MPFKTPEQYAAGDSAAEACGRAIESVKAKANFNARLARWSTWGVVVTGALVPVSLLLSTQGHAFLWGKLVPGLLGVLTAVIAAVLQFERPHERWRFYRGYQRSLETERLAFETRSGPYAELSDIEAGRSLAQAVAGLQATHHRAWQELVPASAAVAGQAGSAAPETRPAPESDAGESRQRH